VPRTDIEWMVSDNGLLKVSWLQKISNFEEDHATELNFQIVALNETGSFKGTAKESQLENLRFGETYLLTLTDTIKNETSRSFEIETCKLAYNNCNVN